MDVVFGEGDHVVRISYPWLGDNVKDVDILFNGGR